MFIATKLLKFGKVPMMQSSRDCDVVEAGGFKCSLYCGFSPNINEV